MKKIILIGTITAPLAPLTANACSEESEITNYSNIPLENYLSVNIAGNSLDKSQLEVVAYNIQTPNAQHKNMNIGFVEYQMRCGLIGHIKISLYPMTITTTVDSLVSVSKTYNGNKWLPELGGIYSQDKYHWNNTSEYDAYINQFYSWAYSCEDAQSKKAYKLTPLEISYTENWVNASNVKYK